MQAQTKLFLVIVKLIEYIFSAVNECSPNPCVVPLPRIKIYFPLFMSAYLVKVTAPNKQFFDVGSLTLKLDAPSS